MLLTEIELKFEMANNQASCCLPGDVIATLSSSSKTNEKNKVHRLGEGTLQIGKEVIATRSGITDCDVENGRYSVVNNHRYYVPKIDDQVVGIIVDRQAEHFRVDIGAGELAFLSMLSFEGATKRNRPEIKVGNLIYARVTSAYRDMEPQIVCVGKTNKADGYGELKDGYMFDCSIGLARSLLREDCQVINLLGKSIAFECAVGVNGRVWINSKSPQHTVLLTNAILTSEVLKPNQVKLLVETHLKTIT